MAPIKCFLVEKTGECRSTPTGKGCHCGDPNCSRVIRNEPIWKRLDTGETFIFEHIPAGAMWWAPWYADYYKSPDGKILVVRTPGGDWVVDSIASNCTRKDDTVHKCWVRHGEAPDITVDKNGNTCSAGAGSIAMSKAGGCKDDFHGFLRNGYLTSC